MKMLSKTLIAFAILSFFSLGVVSVSFANRVPSSASHLWAGKYHGSLKDKPQTDKRTLHSGMLFEEDAEPLSPPSVQYLSGGTAGASLEREWVFPQAPPNPGPKVSTCILNSVLNL